jgi:transitional endoplasmic reticulum ATPase
LLLLLLLLLLLSIFCRQPAVRCHHHKAVHVHQHLVTNRPHNFPLAGVRARVLSQLLAELDGLQPRLQVIAVAATNRPDLLDPALLRPGRFDRLIYVPVPDCRTRAAILRVLTRQLRISADVDTAALAERTEGFTGADLKALCQAAAFSALDESLEACSIEARHVDAALQSFRASPPVEEEVMAMFLSMHRGIVRW